MAWTLYKYLRGKHRARQEEKNGLPTSEEYHLVPVPRSSNSASNSLPSQITEGMMGHTDGSQSQRAESMLNHEENARIREETKRRRKYRWKILASLILPNFLAAVDTTIVAPAVPMISSHFNQLSGSFNWIVASYTLTYTTFVPSSGMIADVYGRHAGLQFHMVLILLGAVLCASSASWGMLLVGRALQGGGAAGIGNLTNIILSDNVSLADNSKNNTIFSLLSGCSYAIGPVIGGYLASADWRYCFVLPIPVACISMLLIFFLMRPELVKGRVSYQTTDSRRTGYITGLLVFDWPGIILFIFGVGLVILAIQWGGTEYSWSSATVIACLVIGFILWILFYIHEYLLSPGRIMNRIFPNQTPMCPSYLYRKKDTILLMIVNFASGSSLVSAFYFISIYWQLAEGYGSSQAGIQLLYYTPGLGAGVYLAMFFCNVWPRQTFYPLMIGSVVEAVGIAVLSWAADGRKGALVSAMLALSGAGTGLRFMPVILHAAGIWPTRITAVQSLMSFAMPLGETIGITMMGAVFSNKLSQGLGGSFPDSPMDGGAASQGPESLDALEGLPPDVLDAVQNAAARAVMWSFVSILPFMGVSILASALLGNVWIGRDAEKGKKGKAAKPEVKGRVLDGFFLKAALAGSAEANAVEIEKAGDDRGAAVDSAGAAAGPGETTTRGEARGGAAAGEAAVPPEGHREKVQDPEIGRDRQTGY